MENSIEAIKYLVSKSKYSFDDLCLLVGVLRSENGCPWDREQTNKSIRNCFIDETYEFIEGLDNDDNELMCEELGDVLFQIIFHADIKSDDYTFSINNVVDGICKKMILRHPHVFGDVSVANSGEVLVNWENIKNDEKSRKTPYEQLDSVSKSLPSMMRAQKLISKAKKNSLIESKDITDAIDSVEHALAAVKSTNSKEDLSKLLFEVASLCSAFDVEGEEILYIENNNFINKFKS